MRGVRGRSWQVTDSTPTGTATGNASGSGGRAATEVPFVTDTLAVLGQWFPGWAVDLFEASVVLLLAYAVGKLVVRFLGRRLARQFNRPSLTRTVIRGIRIGIFALAFLLILRIFDMTPTNIAVSVGVFTAVVGVILAPIVGSVISGVFLLADQPYEIGDMIELVDTDQRGFVEDITLRYTKIFTLDNTFLVIPNGEIRKRDVANFSAEDTRTRLRLDVVVTYESDVAEARRLIERSARDVDVVIEGGPDIRVGAARYPAKPTCYIDQFGDHGIHLALRYWISEPYKLLAARSAVQTNVWEAFADEDVDVEIAYPHSHLYFDETSGAMQVSLSGDDDAPSPMGHGVEDVAGVPDPTADEPPGEETE